MNKNIFQKSLGLFAVYLFSVAQMFHWEGQGMPMLAAWFTAMINTVPMMCLWRAMEDEEFLE